MYPEVKKHENKAGIRDYVSYSVKNTTNSQILEAVQNTSLKAQEEIKEMGMEVLHIEREEVSSEFSTSTEDSDADNGEQLDENMNQNTNVIKDAVREVCMDNPTDIVKDVQTLSNVVSDVKTG